MPQENEQITPDGVVAITEVTTEVTPAITEVATIETAEPEVNFNDFKAAAEAPLMTPEPKKVEEVKPEVKTVVVPEAKKEGTALATAKKVATARDYTGLPEDTIPLFQRMSNEAFEKFKPFYQEALVNKQKLEELQKNPAAGAKQVIPDNYYEHPEAYTLTPEYSKAASEAQEAQLVLEHWQSQLDEVRNGATEYRTLQRDPKSGQIVYGAAAKVDQRTQSSLEAMFYNANTQANKFSQNLGAVRASFQDKHTSALKDLRTFESDFFKVYEDPAHPAQVLIKDTIARMNPAFRNNPLASVVAKSVITIQALTRALQDKEASGTTQATPAAKTKTAQSKAGPTASGFLFSRKHQY